MKRIMLRKPFDIDIENAAAPVPDREQILVRTRAIGITAGTEMALYLGTYHDLVLRRWKPQWEYPMYTGYEAVGEVVKIGPDVYEPNVGDRVLLYWHQAEYSVADTSRVLRLPDTLAAEDALLRLDGMRRRAPRRRGLGRTGRTARRVHQVLHRRFRNGPLGRVNHARQGNTKARPDGNAKLLALHPRLFTAGGA